MGFARPAGFRWLLGGHNVADRSGDVGVAAALALFVGRPVAGGYREIEAESTVGSDEETPTVA